jgi:glycosyltransferase involved in cell wall biosynthesis
MDISVVIPLYNEEESLPELVAWIRRVMAENRYSYEIVLVDDGSTDRSWEVIRELSGQESDIRAFRFRSNYGKSAALQTGFQETRGAVVITMDADMQDSPDEIPELYRLIHEEGYDLISGYKKVRHDPITKTVPSKFFNWITRKFSGIPNLHDFNCGLKSYRGEVVKNIEVYGEMHRYIPVIAKWAGFSKIGEKIVQHRPRKYGVTKFGINRFINGFLDLLTLVVLHKYLKQPMHFFGTWGTFFSLMGGTILLILGIGRIFFQVYLTNRMPILMFGTITLLLGMILFTTGLLAELIGRHSPYKNQYNIKDKIGDWED